MNSLVGKTVSEKRKKYSLKARKINSTGTVSYCTCFRHYSNDGLWCIVVRKYWKLDDIMRCVSDYLALEYFLRYDTWWIEGSNLFFEILFQADERYQLQILKPDQELQVMPQSFHQNWEIPFDVVHLVTSDCRNGVFSSLPKSIRSTVTVSWLPLHNFSCEITVIVFFSCSRKSFGWNCSCHTCCWCIRTCFRHAQHFRRMNGPQIKLINLNQ